MGEPHIHTTLVAKRAELSGELIRLEKESLKIRDQISHIDHVLALFEYPGEPSEIKPVQRRKNRFKPYEVAKLIRRYEADAGATLPRNELVSHVILHKGWDIEDRKLQKQVADAVKHAKRSMRINSA